MELLSLRGRSALSAFRVAKLLDGLAAARPAHPVVGVAANWQHFVEVSRPLAAAERATLERLLTYGPRDAAEAGGAVSLLVVPRPGTISPWSSKATDIAHNCGLAAVNRIERGALYRVRTRDDAPLVDGDLRALLPLIHDRMIEIVLDDAQQVEQLFAHLAPRPLGDRAAARAGPRGAGARQCRARARAGRRRDRLPRRELPRARPRSRPTSSS